MTLIVFGDSITLGCWDTNGGWVQRLKKYFDKKNITDPDFYSLVYNLGVSGDTSKGLLERFETELKPRRKKDELVLLFAIGINDSLYLNGEKKNQVSSIKCKSNINKLVQKAKKYSNQVFFLGLTQVDESRTNPRAWDKNTSYFNTKVKEYNNIIKQACKENNVHFIPVYDKISVKDLVDGVHPNNKGHEKIYEIVKQALSENKII